MTINEILSDNTSGSSEIAERILVWLTEEFSSDRMRNIGELNHLFEKIISTFPHFAILDHLTKYLLKNLKRISGIRDIDERRIILKAVIDKYQSTWSEKMQQAAIRISENVDFDKKKIFLHSHSGSIIVLFRKLSAEKRQTSIIQTISEPAKEGIFQARQLAALGFEVTLISEATAGRWMRYADMLLTGADAIYSDFMINKTGTMLLALLFRHYQKPFYVLTDSRKISSREFPSGNPFLHFSESEKPFNEIWDDPPEGIRPVNYYFEPVPLNLVNHLFTEIGIYNHVPLILKGNSPLTQHS